MSRPPLEDDRIQLTLRLPGALHRLLTERTPQGGSLNAEIVRRLELSIADDEMEDLAAIVDSHGDRLDKIEDVLLDILAANGRQDRNPEK